MYSYTSLLIFEMNLQILSKLALGEGEEAEVIEKIENSCIKFDHDKKGVNNKIFYYYGIFL